MNRPLGQRFLEYSGMSRDRIKRELFSLRDPRSGASQAVDRAERIADLKVRLRNETIRSEDPTRVDH